MTPEQATELKNTILWEELCKEIDGRIGYYTNQLITCGPSDLITIQRNIAALQSVKNIPDDVIERDQT